MSNKYIIVPEDQQAMNDLDYDNAIPEQLIGVVLRAEEFGGMECRIFSAIANIATVNIDNGEDENIQDSSKLEKVL